VVAAYRAAAEGTLNETQARPDIQPVFVRPIVVRRSFSFFFLFEFASFTKSYPPSLLVSYGPFLSARFLWKKKTQKKQNLLFFPVSPFRYSLFVMVSASGCLSEIKGHFTVSRFAVLLLARVLMLSELSPFGSIVTANT